MPKKIFFSGIDYVDVGSLADAGFLVKQRINTFSDDKETTLGTVDKLIVKGERIYALDDAMRRIVVFSQRLGVPEMVLNRRGRGPEEYQNITDFDIDEDGNIIILDSRKNNIITYSADGRFIKKKKQPFDLCGIKVLPGGSYLCSVAPWDIKRAAGYRVIVADTSLVVTDKSIKASNRVDPNFTFPGYPFSESNGMIFYNVPIDDDVHVFSKNGSLDDVYHFNFGAQIVPGRIRKSVERHMKEISDCVFLVNTISINDSLICGAVDYRGSFKNFVLSRNEDHGYLIDIISTGMVFLTEYAGDYYWCNNSTGEILKCSYSGSKR